MKKFLFSATLLCSISFSGKAAAREGKSAVVTNMSKANSKVAKPFAACLLYIMDFSCPAQGWTIPVVGRTEIELAEKYMWYQTHLDC